MCLIAALATRPLLAAGPSLPRLLALATNGPTAERINIVVLPEGYREEQLASFRADAQRIAQRLLATPPLDEYASSFNLFAIEVASNESGADQPRRGLYRDTYFNSTFDSYNSDRLLTIPPNDIDREYAHGQGKVDALLREWMPEYDIVFLIVNDTRYGGSGGTFAIASIAPSAEEIVIHELGHSFAGLGDEYEDPYPGYPDVEEPNTTRETRRDRIKWASWIDPSTPVPTPVTPAYASKVGLFQGAHYHATGWYRPQAECKMRSLGQPFCDVCAETVVLSHYRLLPPIVSAFPSNALVTLGASGATFQIGLVPALDRAPLQWEIDTRPVPGLQTRRLRAGAGGLSPGEHSVRVRVFDPTPRMRNDPSGLARGSREWRVSVAVSPPHLELFPPVLLAPGAPAVEWIGPPGSVLEAAVSLENWQPLQTNELGVGLWFTGPMAAERRFFRARTGAP